MTKQRTAAKDKCRITFYLPLNLIDSLEAYTAELKASDRALGRRVSSLSSVTEQALRKHLPRRNEARLD